MIFFDIDHVRMRGLAAATCRAVVLTKGEAFQSEDGRVGSSCPVVAQSAKSEAQRAKSEALRTKAGLR